jgi:hypothetical protein
LTRPIYLTARCTRGCEMWAPPEEMERHVRDKRCNGHAWFRGVEQTMLLDTRWARLLRASGGETLLDFERMQAYRTRDARRPHLPLSVQFGAVLASPVDGVTARVWWYVLKPHLLTCDDARAVVARAMTDDGFTALAPADLANRLVACGSCGDVVIDLAQHQRSSRRCKMAAAANRVIELWHAGFRDPWTVPGSAPLTWTELRASRWRKQLAVVEFPKWNAVLVGALQPP